MVGFTNSVIVHAESGEVIECPMLPNGSYLKGTDTFQSSDAAFSFDLEEEDFEADDEELIDGGDREIWKGKRRELRRNEKRMGYQFVWCMM